MKIKIKRFQFHKNRCSFVGTNANGVFLGCFANPGSCFPHRSCHYHVTQTGPRAAGRAHPRGNSAPLFKSTSQLLPPFLRLVRAFFLSFFFLLSCPFLFVLFLKKKCYNSFVIFPPSLHCCVSFLPFFSFSFPFRYVSLSGPSGYFAGEFFTGFTSHTCVNSRCGD